MDVDQRTTAQNGTDSGLDDDEQRVSSNCCQKSTESTEIEGVVNAGFVDAEAHKLQQHVADTKRPEVDVIDPVTLDLQTIGLCQCERVGHLCHCKIAAAAAASEPKIRYESWGRWKCRALSAVVGLTCIWLVIYISLHYNNLL